MSVCWYPNHYICYSDIIAYCVCCHDQRGEWLVESWASLNSTVILVPWIDTLLYWCTNGLENRFVLWHWIKLFHSHASSPFSFLFLNLGWFMVFCCNFPLGFAAREIKNILENFKVMKEAVFQIIAQYIFELTNLNVCTMLDRSRQEVRYFLSDVSWSQRLLNTDSDPKVTTIQLWQTGAWRDSTVSVGFTIPATMCTMCLDLLWHCKVSG